MTPWTVAHQAPLSIGFSRQEYWSGLPFPPPGDLPDTGIEPTSATSPALEGEFFTTVPPGRPIKPVLELKWIIQKILINQREVRRREKNKDGTNGQMVDLNPIIFIVTLNVNV